VVSNRVEWGYGRANDAAKAVGEYWVSHYVNIVLVEFVGRTNY